MSSYQTSSTRECIDGQRLQEPSQDQRALRVSFIVPVYNEERNVLEVIQRLKALPLDKEIIVVDDGSYDSTPALLKRYKDDPQVVVHLSQLNFGKGTAIRVGLKYASGDIIAIQDGDMEYNVQDYLRIIEKFSDPHVMVVYGSRFAGKIHSPMIWRYWFGNMLLRFLANVLYRAEITDEATAYKAFRREVITQVPLRCQRFEFCPEITAKLRKRGHKIHEVPIEYDPRGIAEGKKIRAKDGMVAIWTLLRLRLWKD